MPTYEYACRNCGHEFELFQQMTDPVKRKCPKCSKLSLERLIGTGAGIIFKGSGFYETDYRSESYRKAARAETAAADGSGNGSKSDAKKDGVKSSSEGKSNAAGSGKAKKAEAKPAAST
jgi:putative FmdB family regulatory protein